MNIRMKLIACAMVVVLTLILVGGVGFFYINKTAQASTDLADAQELLDNLNQIRKEARDILLQVVLHIGDQDPESMTKRVEEINTSSAQLETRVTQYQEKVKNSTLFSSNHQTTEFLAAADSFLKQWQQFQEIRQQIITLSQDYEKEGAFSRILEEATPVLDQAIAFLVTSNQNYLQQVDQLSQNVKTSRRNSTSIIALVTILISVVMGIGGFLLANSIINPLLRISKSINQLGKNVLISELGEGDLKRQDELGEISRDYNITQ